MFLLRPYQKQLISDVYSYWKSNTRRVMAQLATGGGKTVVFGSIVRDCVGRRKRALILSHREELVFQARDKVSAIAGVPVGVIKGKAPQQPELAVQSASIQTLIRRPTIARDFDLIIIDEAHHAKAQSYRTILDRYPNAFHLGVTATPIRTDNKGFDDIFEVMVRGPSVSELTQEGYLAPFRLFADANPMNTAGSRTTGGDFNQADLARINDARRLSGNLLTAWQKYARGKRTAIFAVNCEHSEAIARRFRIARIPAEHLDAKTKPNERRAILQRFSEGETLALCNCGIITEGFDVPAIEAVQIARPTQSLALWLQMLGRALRPHPQKPHATLIDHTDNWQRLGMPDHPHAWVLEGLEPKPGKRKTFRDRISGEVQTLELPLELEDITLEEVDLAEARRAIELKTLARLISIQEDKGYNKAWVAFEFVRSSPSLEGLKECARWAGYKPGWANVKYSERGSY